MSIDWQPLRDLIEKHQKFVLTSHLRPDADAIGSEIGFAGILRQWGKDVTIINPSATPAHLQFLDPKRLTRHVNHDIPGSAINDADLVVILDTSAWGQLGEVGDVLKSSSRPRIVIDHHQSADNLNATEFKDSQREATGSLVAEIAETFGVPITQTMATSLYAAIATDTGWFRFPSTSAQTMRIIGRLMDAGADPATIFQELYERGSLARIRLAGRALGRVVLTAEGKLAYTFVSNQDFAELGATAADTEELVNQCLTIKGTTAAFIAVEQPTRQVKISFRARRGMDVAVVAEKFGGGGHRLAAGATLPGPVDEAVRRALEAVLTAIPES